MFGADGMTGVTGGGLVACCPDMISTFSMITGFKGASLLNCPTVPVGVSPMRSITSMPCTTRPNTV